MVDSSRDCSHYMAELLSVRLGGRASRTVCMCPDNSSLHFVRFVAVCRGLRIGLNIGSRHHCCCGAFFSTIYCSPDQRLSNAANSRISSTKRSSEGDCTLGKLYILLAERQGFGVWGLGFGVWGLGDR